VVGARAQSGSGVGGREDANLLGKVAQEGAQTEPLRRQRRRRVVHVEKQTLHSFQLFPPPTRRTITSLCNFFPHNKRAKIKSEAILAFHKISIVYCSQKKLT